MPQYKPLESMSSFHLDIENEGTNTDEDTNSRINIDTNLCIYTVKNTDQDTVINTNITECRYKYSCSLHAEVDAGWPPAEEEDNCEEE